MSSILVEAGKSRNKSKVTFHGPIFQLGCYKLNFYRDLETMVFLLSWFNHQNVQIIIYVHHGTKGKMVLARFVDHHTREGTCSHESITLTEEG